jgi:predicted DsbA family dithiol-disulfide isomerase
VQAPVEISHFSDVLCVWAYVSQVRLDELGATFGERIQLDWHFFPVFADTRSWLADRWGERGGAVGYGDHVRKIVEEFDSVTIHPNVWNKTRPRSSVPCHQYLAAVRIVGEELADGDMLSRTLWSMREAFFRDGRDISDAHVRREVAGPCGVPTDQVDDLISDGSAHAALFGDTQLSRKLNVVVSPTLVFNQGRQRLQGNVGYRIIEANVRELLERPVMTHSWC